MGDDGTSSACYCYCCCCYCIFPLCLRLRLRFLHCYRADVVCYCAPPRNNDAKTRRFCSMERYDDDDDDDDDNEREYNCKAVNMIVTSDTSIHFSSRGSDGDPWFFPRNSAPFKRDVVFALFTINFEWPHKIETQRNLVINF